MAYDISNTGMNVINSFRQGQADKRDDVEYQRQQTARKLFGTAMQGDKASRDQLYGVDPALAMQAQKQQSQMDVDVAKVIHRGATLIKNAPEEQKANIYMAVRSELARNPKAAEWVARMPEQYDAQAVGQSVDQIIAQAGLYQDEDPSQAAPAGLRQFEAMAANAGLQKGTPEYMKAAQIYLGQEARARNQVYDSADGANVIKMGGGNAPTAAPVMTAPVESAPIYNGGGAVDAGRAISDPNGDFNSLNAIEKAKFNSFAQQGKSFQIVDGKVIPGMSAGVQLQPAPKQTAGSFNQLSAQEVQAMGLPAGTVAQRGPNGQVSIISKPETVKRKELSVDVIKNAAQLPALARRIERVAQASEKINGMFDGGKLDQYALSMTNDATELEAAAAQLRPLLLSFVRVPGIGSQSDLEARLDGLQYPDVSQPPATRKKNVDELRIFIKDLSEAYKSIATGGTQARQAPANPSGKKDYSSLF